MQNDFGATGGMFDRAASTYPAFERRLPNRRGYFRRSKSSVPIVYLKMAFTPTCPISVPLIRSKSAFRLSNAGYVDAGTVEHASGGPEVVLHVDYEHGGLSGIELTRAGLRINLMVVSPMGAPVRAAAAERAMRSRCPHRDKEPPPTHIGSSLRLAESLLTPWDCFSFHCRLVFGMVTADRHCTYLHARKHC